MSRASSRSLSIIENESETLEDIFEERKSSFLESLERVVSLTAADKFMQQMFADENSALFVPNRICEIVYHILVDDREEFIKTLMLKVQAIEACFGPARAHQIEQIGNRLLEMASQQAKKEAEQRGCIKILRDQLSALQTELVSVSGSNASVSESPDLKNRKLRQLKTVLRRVKAELKQSSESIKQMQTILPENLKEAKLKLEAHVDKLRSVEKENSELKAAVTEAGKMKRRLTRAAQIIKEKDDEIGRLKVELENTIAGGADVNKLTKKLLSAWKLILEKNEQIKQLQSESGLSDDEIRKKLGKVQRALTRATQAVVDREEQIRALNEQIEALKADKEKRTEETKTLKRKVRDLQTEMSPMRMSLSEVGSPIHKEVDFDVMKKQLKDRDGQIASLEAKIELMKEDENSKSDIMNENERLQMEVSSLKSQLAEKDSKIAALEKPARRTSGSRGSVISDTSGFIDLASAKFAVAHSSSQLLTSPSHLHPQASVPVNLGLAHSAKTRKSRFTLAAVDDILNQAELSGRPRQIISKCLIDAQRQFDEDFGSINELESQRVMLIQTAAQKELEIQRLTEQLQRSSEMVAMAEELEETVQTQQETIIRLQDELSQQEELAEVDRENEILNERCSQLQESQEQIQLENDDLNRKLESLSEELLETKQKFEYDEEQISRLRVVEKNTREFVGNVSKVVNVSSLDDIERSIIDLKNVETEMTRVMSQLERCEMNDIVTLIEAYKEAKSNEEKLVSVLPSENIEALFDDIVQLNEKCNEQNGIIDKLSRLLNTHRMDLVDSVSDMNDAYKKFKDREKRIEKIAGGVYSFERLPVLVEQLQKRISDYDEAERRHCSMIECTSDFSQNLTKMCEIVNKMKATTGTTSIDDLTKSVKEIHTFRQNIHGKYQCNDDQQVIAVIERQLKVINILSKSFNIEDVFAEAKRITQEYESVKKLLSAENVHEAFISMRRILEQENSMMKLLGTTTSLTDSVFTLQKTHKKLVQILRPENDVDLVQKATDVMEENSKYRGIVTKTKKMIKVGNDDKVTDKITKIVAFRDKVMTKIEVENDEDAFERLSVMKEAWIKLGKLVKTLDTDSSEIEAATAAVLREKAELEETFNKACEYGNVNNPGELLDLVRRNEEIRKTLISMTATDSIDSAVTKIQSEFNLKSAIDEHMKQMQETMKVSDDEELVAKVRRVASELNTLQGVVQQCLESTKQDEENLMLDRVKNLVQMEEQLVRLLSIDPTLDTRDELIVDTVKSLSAFREDVYDAVGTLTDHDAIVKNIAEHMNIVSEVCELASAKPENMVTVIQEMYNEKADAESVLVKCYEVSECSDSETLISTLASNIGTVKEISSLFKGGEMSLTDQVTEVLQVKAEQEYYLTKLMEITSAHDSQQLLGNVTELVRVNRHLLEMLQASDSEDLLKTVAANHTTIGEVMKQISADLQTELPEKVSELLTKLEAQEKYMRAMNSLLNDESGDALQVMRNLTDILAQVMGYLSLTETESVPKELHKLVSIMHSAKSLLQASSNEDIIPKLERMSREVSEQNTIIKHMLQVSNTENTDDMIETIEKARNDVAKSLEIIEAKDSLVDELKTIIANVRKAEKNLGCDQGDDLSSHISAIKKELSDSHKLVKRLVLLAKLQNETELEPKLKQLISDESKIMVLLDTKESKQNVDSVRDLVQTIRKVTSLVPGDSESNITARISAMKKELSDCEKCIDQLKKSTKTSEKQDLIRKVAQMATDESRIATVLGSEEGESHVAKAKRAAALLQKIRSLTNTKGGEFIPVITELQRKHDIIDRAIQRISGCSDANQGCEKIKESVVENQKSKSVLKLAPNDSLVDRVMDMSEELKRISEILPKSQMERVDAISELLLNMRDSERVTQRLAKATGESDSDAICAMVEDLVASHKSIEDTLKDWSSGPIHGKVAELKAIVDDIVNEADCDVRELPSHVKSMKHELEKLNDHISQAKAAADVSDEEELIQTCHDLIALRENVQQLYGTDNMNEAIEQASFNKIMSHKVTELLGDNPADRLEDLMKECEERKTLIANCLEITQAENEQAMVDHLQALVDIEKGLLSLLNTDNSEAIVDAVKENLLFAEKMAFVTGISDGHDAITERVGSVLDLTAQLCGIASTDERDIASFLQTLIYDKKQSDDVLASCYEISQCSDCEGLISRLKSALYMVAEVCSSLQTNEEETALRNLNELVMKTEEINQMMPESWSGDFRNKVQVMHDEFIKIGARVDASEVPGSCLDKVGQICSALDELTAQNEKLKEIFETGDLITAAHQYATFERETEKQLGETTRDNVQPRINELLELECQMKSLMETEDSSTIPQSVQNLITERDSLADEQQKLRSILDTDDLISEADKLREEHKSLVDMTSENVVTDVKSLIEELAEVKQSVATAVALVKSRDFDRSELIPSVTAMCSVFDALRSEHDKISEILKEEGELVPRIEEMSEKIAALMRKLATDDIISSVDVLLARDEETNKLWSSTDSDQSLAKLREVHAILGESSNIPGMIRSLIKEIRDYQSQEKKIRASLPPNENGDLLQEISLLVKQFNELQNIIDSIKAATSSTTNTHAVDSVRDLVALISDLCDTFTVAQSDLVSTARQLSDDRKRVSGLLKCAPSEIVMRVSSNCKSLDACSSFANRLLSILMKSPVSVIHPLPDEISRKFTDFASDFVKQSDIARSEIDDIMKRAKSEGYLEKGTLPDAVAFILDAAVGAERQKNLEEMHSQVKSMREMSEKEKSHFDKAKKDYKQRIEDLRAQITELQERSMARDEECYTQVAEQRTSTIELERALQTEKRIREEFVRLISNTIVDFAFMKQNLTQSEYSAIEKFKSTR